jgi:hypothetical protein
MWIDFYSGEYLLICIVTRCPDSTTLAGRVRAAVKAGAVAVIIYNDIPTKPTAGTLSAPDPVGYRPAGFISQADGQALATRLTAGEEISVFFKQKQTIEDRKTWNVIAHYRHRSPSRQCASWPWYQR